MDMFIDGEFDAIISDMSDGGLFDWLRAEIDTCIR